MTARDPILVAPSHEGTPCHTCGATDGILFLRFRTRATPEAERRAPSEVYLRLCDRCAARLKAQLP